MLSIGHAKQSAWVQGSCCLPRSIRMALGSGMDVELINKISKRVNVPIIASGGVGKSSHVRDAVIDNNVNGIAIGSLSLWCVINLRR